jgi:hypothetical protein
MICLGRRVATTFETDSISRDDGGRGQVRVASSVALILARSVPDLAESVEGIRHSPTHCALHV